MKCIDRKLTSQFVTTAATRPTGTEWAALYVRRNDILNAPAVLGNYYACGVTQITSYGIIKTRELQCGASSKNVMDEYS